MSSPTTTTFTDSDIRPDHLKARQDELFEKDIRRLMEKKALFVRVPCPACAGEASAYLYSKMGQDYETCGRCETVFVNPRPPEDLLAEHYRTAEYYAYWNEHIFPESEDVRREKIVRPRVDRILDICSRQAVGTGALIEIGAGFGTFCEEMMTRVVFDHIIAIEPTPGLADSCRARGLEVIERPIENVNVTECSADVAVAFEVIEHLFSPASFLDSCRRALRPGGLLVLTCPNVKGFDVQILGKSSGSIDPEHLNYFHPASLTLLAQNHGFDVLEVMTPGVLDAELVRKGVLRGELDLNDRPFLRRVILDEWTRLGGAFQDFLAENLLSSHMWLVARRWAS